MAELRENQSSVQPTQLQPMDPARRAPWGDAIRGLALFGILAVNMQWFCHPVLYRFFMQDPTEPLNRIAYRAVQFFLENKSFPLFSIMFGFGLSIQLMRLREKGQSFARFHLRRMAILIGLGLLHGIFIWPVDILLPYGLIGILLLLFIQCKPRTLLIWALAFLSIVVILTVAWGTADLLLSSVQSDTAQATTMSADQQTRMAEYQAVAEQHADIYATGSYGQVLKVRIKEMIVYWVMMFLAGWHNILGMFLIGMYLGKRGIMQKPSDHVNFLKQVAFWGLVTGLGGNLLSLLASEGIPPQLGDVARSLMVAAGVFGSMTLCFFYASGLILLMQGAKWQKRLHPLVQVGRMSLTNYLMQSLVCTLIFNGYGLGYYGKIGAAGGLILTVCIYVVQVGISVAWLSRYRFGPVEWLWRTLVYGRFPAMRCDLRHDHSETN